MTVILALLRGSALRDGSAENAQCGCAVWNPGRWWHRPAGCGSGSEMRSSPLAGCVGDSRPLSGVMLAGSAAGLRPLDRCRVLRSQTMLLLCGSSPTILLLLVADKLLLVVLELAFQAGKRTVRPEQVVCGGRVVVVTGTAGSLRGGAGGLPVSC